jgi:2'-5' RNA ligase superfamily
VVFRGGGLAIAIEPSGREAAPLILTLRMDAAHQARFDALRSAHFPPRRNVLDAHVTLFHALPGHALRAVEDMLAEEAARTPPPVVAVREPFLLGRGVAFRLESPEANALRARIAGRWSGILTAQDRAPPRLHVTVQNKVTPAEARTLLEKLLPPFQESRFVSPGLDLWSYLGGPWRAEARFEFAG